MIFCDSVEGVVVIPQDFVSAVLNLLPKLVAADDLVKADVDQGGSVFEAFKSHRSPDIPGRPF